RYYFDCQPDTELANPNIGLKDHNFSAIGLGTSADRWFGGEIDELRVWNRALSEQELQGLCEPCLKPFYVDKDAPAGGDGKTWATAHDNLQDALDASVACASPKIWIAEGAYVPDDHDVPAATISAPVSIYGGFEGTETSLGQRDFVAHQVRLGDTSWDTRIVEVLDTAIEVGNVVRLDGIRISGSWTGAIKLQDNEVDTEEPLVRLHNLTISAHKAPEGAGVWTEGAFGVEIVGSHFTSNQYVGVGGRGAAIYSRRSRLHIDDCVFADNESDEAVVYNDWNLLDDGDWGSVYISDSVFSGNAGGAIAGPHVTVINSEFTANRHFQ